MLSRILLISVLNFVKRSKYRLLTWSNCLTTKSGDLTICFATLMASFITSPGSTILLTMFKRYASSADIKVSLVAVFRVSSSAFPIWR